MAVRQDRSGRPDGAGGLDLPARAAAALWRGGAHIAGRDEPRLVLWWPVGFAVGIGAWFALPFEPDWRAGGIAAAASLAGAIALSRAPWAALCAALGVLSLTSGFAAASLRAHVVAAPAIAGRMGPVTVAGTVVEVARRGDARIAVRMMAHEIGTLPPERLPDHVRVTMPMSHAGTVVAGDRVRLRAVLLPPPGPASPGGFDFAREAWFDRLGAVGFSLSAIDRLGRAEAGALEGIDYAIERLRMDISSRILAVAPGPEGAISAALLTGKRGAIPEEVLGKLRDSGLAHLLAISGLHMALVCGTVFGAVTLALALVPWIALRTTVHKWGAAAALAAGLGYFLLAGGSVATERAFIMAVISLGAVLLDRPAITFRNVAIAATITLALRPESLNQAGFQMSFGAVIALVAFYEGLRAYRRRRPAERRTRPGPARTAALIMAAVAATTIVATLATGPVAAYHFNRVATFGLIANLVAVPITGFVVMPLGVAALALMPFGLDAVPLGLMAAAIGVIIDVAGWVAGLEGAVRLVPAMPPVCLALFAAGGLWICLWRQPWRAVGLVPVAAAAWIGLAADQPDLLVAREGRNIALRDGAGQLSIALPRIEAYTAEQWLRRDGDARTPGDAAPGHFSCDDMACVARAANGLEIAYVLRRDALTEECWRADVLITPLIVTIACRARLVIDLSDLRAGGPHAVSLADDGTIANVVAAREIRGERPWSRTGR
jgi:competence protein ComEC